MKQTSLDALNAHLFETIEMLKNNNDTEASANEKIDLETAKAIGNIGKVIVEGYKVKAQVFCAAAKADNPELIKQLSIGGGISDSEDVKPGLKQ